MNQHTWGQKRQQKVGYRGEPHPTAPLLGIYPEETVIENDISVHCNTVYNS